MRFTIVVFSLFAATSALPSAAQIKDTRLAEAICRGDGFLLGSPAYGRCVMEKMAIIYPTSASSPTKRTGQAEPAKALDPYAALADDFERANFAYRKGRYEDAFTYMLKAARTGDSRAFVHIGRYYMDGIGASADPTKGLFWLRKAEAGRDPASYPLLAKAHLDGRGVPQDLQRAFSYVEVARAAGAVRQSQEIEQILAQRVGSDPITCARYGMALATSENGQCRLQLEQARQQARFAQQQYQLQFEQYQRQMALYEAQQEAIKKEKERRKWEMLGRLGAGMANSTSPTFLGALNEGLAVANGMPLARPVAPPPPALPSDFTLRFSDGSRANCTYDATFQDVRCR